MYPDQSRSQIMRIGGKKRFISTCVIFLFCLKTFIDSPFLTKKKLWTLPLSIPEEKKNLTLPFFYTMTSWPKTFLEKPIYYMIPYEKGPPLKFIGRILVYLEKNKGHFSNEIILEGPKTPPGFLSQKDLRNCFLKNTSFHCIKARKNSIKRHLKEMNLFPFFPPTLYWFEVENPALDQEEKIQGIYLSGYTKKQTLQDRFIIVNKKGIHQTFILNRKRTTSGLFAFEEIQKIIGSLKNFNDLSFQRNWINQLISKIELSSLEKIQDKHEFLLKFSEIQAMLMSKISLEPSHFDSYYHLAGICGTYGKNSEYLNNDWKLTCSQNLSSAYQFAKDLNPTEPRIILIEQILRQH